jgi:hypothetical protein
MTNSERSPRQAAAETARKFGLSTNDVYARLARLKTLPHLDRTKDDLLP